MSNLHTDKNTVSLKPPSRALPNALSRSQSAPQSVPPMYSNIFANVGKCVMMPIDKNYEAKYLLMNK